jgi:CheY-like chemotaxis protein
MQVSAAESPFRSRSSRSRSRRREQVTPFTILLAEDDDDLRQLLATVLRAEGYGVIEVRDGEQLLAAVASQSTGDGDLDTAVDLIVSDIRMPGPSGLWVLASLRHIDWATPFVVITAFADAATFAEARRLGAAAVLSKPIALDDLRNTLLNLTGPPAS